MAKILISGVSGWIGGEIARCAVMAGHEVIGVGRHRHSEFISGAFLEADIADASLVRYSNAPELCGVDAVIHCAGLAHVSGTSREWEDRFDRVNRVGTQNVVELSRRIGVKRGVYISSTSVYNWGAGSDAVEAGNVAPRTAYARSKFAGEQVCGPAEEWRIVRLSTVFGAGDRANFAKLADALRGRRFFKPGNGSAAKSIVPVDLVADLTVALACMPKVPYRVVNVALPVPPTLAEICDAFSDLCGFPSAPAVPLPVLRFAAEIGDVAATMYRGFPVTTETLKKLITRTVVNVDRMMSIWPQYRWPTFREALEKHAEFYRHAARRR